LSGSGDPPPGRIPWVFYRGRINVDFWGTAGADDEETLKRTRFAVSLRMVTLLATVAWAGEQKKDVTERLQMATEVLSQMTSEPDKAIPEEVLESAKCIAVVPHLVKGGFVFGGKHGRGVASCRTANGWSAPAFISIGGGSSGLQIGMERVDLIMLIMNERGMQQLLSNKFQLGGEGTAAAGPVGRDASAGTDWKIDTEVLTYSRSKGVFAGLTLEGAVVEQDVDSTAAVYGKDVSFRKVLMGGVKPTAVANRFMEVLASTAYEGPRPPTPTPTPTPTPIPLSRHPQ
jgi:SH3 domain-containing YSC84-like protein 1